MSIKLKKNFFNLEQILENDQMRKKNHGKLCYIVKLIKIFNKMSKRETEKKLKNFEKIMRKFQ